MRKKGKLKKERREQTQKGCKEKGMNETKGKEIRHTNGI
jgi:hypothetical protein